ncbi:MAG: hypothetical protein QXJ06_03550, partial [Candidatus Aenigmatarchaeota archaeon]
MKKVIVIIISLMLVVIITGMGNKAGAEDVSGVVESATGTAKELEPVNKGIPGVSEEIGVDGVRTITINLSE